MDVLRINLIGHVTVSHPKFPTPLNLARSSQSLLAYLLLQQHLVPRDVLMDVFWLDHSPDRARSSLTTALWRLRQHLEPDGIPSGTYLLTRSSGEVGFNWESAHWLDINWFEQHTRNVLAKPLTALGEADFKQIEEILTRYHGDLLEGMYEDWALRERERFRLRYLNCLTRLMEFYASCNSFDQSIAYGQEILRRDPLREDIHRDLMRIYLTTGQRTLAIRQYTQCRKLLNQELGIPPLQETETLYQQILATSAGNTPAQEQLVIPEITHLLHEIRNIKRNLDENTRALARLVQMVNRLMDQNASEITGEQPRRP